MVKVSGLKVSGGGGGGGDHPGDAYVCQSYDTDMFKYMFLYLNTFSSTEYNSNNTHILTY